MAGSVAKFALLVSRTNGARGQIRLAEARAAASTLSPPRVYPPRGVAQISRAATPAFLLHPPHSGFDFLGEFYVRSIFCLFKV